MGLENILKTFKTFNRKLLTSSVLASSLIAGCSESGTQGPTNPQNSNPPNGPTTPQNSPRPTITSICPTQVNENSLYECQVQARSNSSNPLNYSLPQGPNWLSVSNNFTS